MVLGVEEPVCKMRGVSWLAGPPGIYIYSYNTNSGYNNNNSTTTACRYSGGNNETVPTSVPINILFSLLYIYKSNKNVYLLVLGKCLVYLQITETTMLSWNVKERK